jgi:hypothetical protein
LRNCFPDFGGGLKNLIEVFKIVDNHGPEDVALDKQGRIYGATHEGNIARLQPEGSIS